VVRIRKTGCGRVRRVPVDRLRDYWQDVAGPAREVLDALVTTPSRTSAPEDCLELAYHYGDSVVRNGRLQPPCGDRASVCPDCSMVGPCAAYSAIPLVAILTGAVEVYDSVLRNTHTLTVPRRILQPGEMFGVFETLDSLCFESAPTPQWDISAGARSVHLLWHTKSQLTIDAVLAALDSRLTLLPDELYPRTAELIASLAQRLPWEARLLILPQRFLKSTAVLHALYRIAWEQSRALRDEATADLAMPIRFARHYVNFYRVDPFYFSRTVAHLLAIATGEVPALAPVLDNSEKAGPFAAFQTLLRDTTLLGDRFPALVAPLHLTVGNPVGYYSFNYPTLSGPIPPPRNNAELASVVASALFKCIEPTDLLDKGAVRFFGRFKKVGRHAALLPLESIDAAEFVPEEMGTLQYSHPFFTGCARLVRRSHS
jgi:hypothetical protein